MAVINLFYWLFSFGANVLIDLNSRIKEQKEDDNNSNSFVAVCSVLILSLISNILIWKRAKTEFRELIPKLRCCCCRRKEEDIKFFEK